MDMPSIKEGLWANGRDSILHALLHFSERDREQADRKHHDKWIVLSVHHAAECLCNMRLVEFTPSAFLRDGKLWFPSLNITIGQLKQPQNNARLSPAERYLLSWLSQMSDIRHQFMHRLAPEDADVSVAAICMIGLLKQIEKHEGETASDLICQSPSIEGDVVKAIRWQRLDDYNKVVALFIREKYPDRHLEACPACGVPIILSSECEACFEQLDYVRCAECDEETYFMAWQRHHGIFDVDCQGCGIRLKA